MNDLESNSRKKLIEVSIPLEAINAATARGPWPAGFQGQGGNLSCIRRMRNYRPAP